MASSRSAASPPGVPLSPASFQTAIGPWRLRPGPAYLALASALGDRILDGQLVPGTRLPSERAAASACQISRRTVTAAYGILQQRKLVTGRRGSGTYVRGPATAGAPGRMPWAPEGLLAAGGAVLDLALAAPARPHPAVAPALAAAAASVAALRSPGYNAAGLHELRDAIARRYTSRGVPTTPDQVLVTSGAQQALDVALRQTIGPGEVAIVEDPTYPAALDALRTRRARIAAIHLDESGWDLDELDVTVRRHSAAVIYVIPDYHMPTGMVMNDQQRERLVQVSRGARLIIDESLCELGFGPGHLPVAAFDDFDRVISIGSLSKVYWGGLRIGWIRANTELVNELTYAKAASDLSCPYVEQRAAADLMAQLDRHLPLVRAELMQRCRVLCDALKAHFPSWRVPQPCGGVVAWVQAPGLPTDALARNASRFRLRLVGGSRFSAVGGHTDRLRLPFTLQHDELVQSVSNLAELAAWWTTHGRPESFLRPDLPLSI
jgi:DNA-binding transcriptional MocR family regulator